MASGNGSAARKTTDESTGVGLIPQPHGGALKPGGTRGNRGGGRTASAVRKALLVAGAKRIPVLEAIADGRVPIRETCPKCGYEPDSLDALAEAPKHADRVRAVNVMLTHGLDDKALTLGSVQERILMTADLLRSTLAPDVYESIAPRLRAIWNAT